MANVVFSSFWLFVFLFYQEREREAFVPEAKGATFIALLSQSCYHREFRAIGLLECFVHARVSVVLSLQTQSHRNEFYRFVSSRLLLLLRLLGMDEYGCGAEVLRNDEPKKNLEFKTIGGVAIGEKHRQ